MGKEGVPVYAVASGYVSRIKVSNTGFGNALYIDHPNGFTSVYAHLHHFADSLVTYYVDSAQKAARSYEVELYPDSGRFWLEQRQMIALSGNSGSSEGPHLHFELRQTKNQLPVNPLGFGLAYNDTSGPVIKKVLLYRRLGDRFELSSEFPADSASHVKDNKIFLVDTDTLGVGVLASDPDSLNANGIYGIELYMDGLPAYKIKYDSLSFDETRYVNCQTDYSYWVGNKARIYRCYRLPGDQSKVIVPSGSGALCLPENRAASIDIFVYDRAGNSSCIDFRIQKDSSAPTPDSGYSGQVISYTQEWSYDDTTFGITVPKGALYEDWIASATYVSLTDSITPYYLVWQPRNLTPLHKPAIIRFRKMPGIFPLDAKTGMARMNDKGRVLEFIPAEKSYEGLVTGKFRSPGYYGLIRDTLPPLITASKRVVDEVDGKTRFCITAIDDISGIGFYEVLQDGEWIPASRTISTGEIKWLPSGGTILPSRIKVILKDVCGNSREEILYF